MGKKKPRLLIVTPEITYLPDGMGNMANHLGAKAGGLADVSAALVSSLYETGVDVHVALPHYRTMFNRKIGRLITKNLNLYRARLADDQIHLAEDRCFYYRESVYDNFAAQNMKLSLAFQREIINNILPRVKPDIIHCNDWMTGLIPAVAKTMGIPCLFTVHNIHTLRTTLDQVEDAGIDAAQFWPHLYYERPPVNYEETRERNRIDFLVSGIFSSTAINTVSPKFLEEIVNGRHDFVDGAIVREFGQKLKNGMAAGVLNSPDPSYNPATDPALARNFDADSFIQGKAKNKQLLQHRMGLVEDPNAPILFWPSRLDPVQKGCDLLGEILTNIISKYSRERLQLVIVANGPYQANFHEIVRKYDLHRRVSVCDFGEKLSHLGYAASDFIIMPSSFEPCGLPQMIGPKYGTLPIAHDTGGIHDTVRPLQVSKNSGNGFLFEVHDKMGLAWAIDQAMSFYRLPQEVKAKQIQRIMRESAEAFSLDVTAQKYRKIYNLLLDMKKQGKN